MKSKILIVEDEKALNEAYQLILTSKGYKVEVAHDGDQGLVKAEKFKPDLILLDLRMPKVNGIEFLKQYKKDQANADVRVIIFSNLDAQKEIDEAYELGADRYILKAWASPNELVQLVRDTLAEK